MLCISALAVVVLAVTACGGRDDYDYAAGDAAYETNIAAETDCSSLQLEAERWANSDPDESPEGRASDQRRAKTVGRRMAEVGCEATPSTTGAPEAPEPTARAAVVMPDVVCMNLQRAQDTIQAAGKFFSDSHDATGAGRLQVIDSNWIVVDQDPAPGELVTSTPDLGAVKYGEPNPCGSAGR
jgi:hypothetical protein